MNEDDLHRIVSGTPLTSTQLRAAGWFIVVWFWMDLVQWVDWLIGKLMPIAGCMR